MLSRVHRAFFLFHIRLADPDYALIYSRDRNVIQMVLNGRL